MKKLIKVFSLVLVLAVLCASIAAFAISSSAAGTYSKETLTAQNFVGAASLDNPSTIGPSIGGTVSGNVVTTPNGDNYVEITANEAGASFAIFMNGDQGYTVKYGEENAFFVFEYDIAAGTLGGVQFMADVNWKYGTVDDEGAFTPGGEKTIQHGAGWMYNGTNYADGSGRFTPNQWHHHTIIVCVYADGSFDGNLYHFIDGSFVGTSWRGGDNHIDRGTIDQDGEAIFMRKLNLNTYSTQSVSGADYAIRIDNVRTAMYTGNTDETAALCAAVGSSKNFSAWTASAGNYGEYALADINVPSANVTIKVGNDTYTGIAPIGVSMEYAAQKIATENGVTLGGAAQVTVTNLGDGNFEITDGAAWTYTSDKVVEGDNIATYAISTPTYVILNSDLSYQSHGFDNSFVSTINSAGDAIVVLNKDVVVPGGSIVFNQVKGTDTLYLNGHSISCATATKFIMVEGAAPNFTIAGPGALNIESIGTDAQLIMAYGQNSNVSFKDLTINFDGLANMTDLRSGTVNFKNCVINSTHKGVIFNLNNGFPHVTPKIPVTVNIDGCEINAKYITGDYIFSFIEYGNRPNNNAENVRELNANINDTVINCGWHDVFVINTTPASFNDGVEAVTNTTVNVTGDTVINYARNLSYKDRHPNFGEGVVINGARSFDNAVLENGNVFAKAVIDGDVKYVVSNIDDCATVYWGYQPAIAEYWVDGSIPVCPRHFAEQVTQVVSAGETYHLNVAPTKSFKIYMNLTLNSDFDLNIYVPVSADVVSITYAGVEYIVDENTPTATIKGASYYVVSKAVAPAEAGIDLIVMVALANDEILTWNASILDYCERVLADPVTYAAEQQLIKDAVAYIKAANVYFGVIEGAEEINTVYATITDATSYDDAKQDSPLAAEGNGGYNSNVANYFKSYTIDLTSAPKIRLYLVDGLNAEITINVWDEMAQWENIDYGVPAYSYDYSIVNGQYEGKNYIELEFKAYQFNSLLEVNMGGGYLVFTAANYVDGATGEAAGVAQALYAYAYSAAKYEAAKA